ncbi:MAG: DUF1015 domain-containing protein [Clostridia bacterium]|nr:DUF1015 domain-containing protein [Clostridia bacterium]
MQKYQNSVGVLVPSVMLPPENTDFSKWAVVACDQFTSQPEYWQAARDYIGNAPTTLDLFLPEAFLGKEGEAERIKTIRENMQRYVKDGVLKELPQGFVLVKRSVAGNTRYGLVLALDLEQYDYSKGSKSLIRATEGTIVDRIPPRLRIREGAPLELPHILVLIDDPDRTVIEPLVDCSSELKKLYDTELMLDGGHITGWLVDCQKRINEVLSALTALNDAEAFKAKYGAEHAPLLFAMGDGNHSFATAKANWEKIKASLPEDERAEHPARYALVEIENVHDEGIVFEPIHRVIFGLNSEKAIDLLQEQMEKQNGSVTVVTGEPLTAQGGVIHIIPFVTANGEGAFVVENPSAQLAVGTLQNAIDAVLKAHPEAEVDYIHGANVVSELAKKSPDNIGFILPAMEKGELFPTVVFDGALPRKTFSMGEANEKRYYLECRSIEK